MWTIKEGAGSRTQQEQAEFIRQLDIRSRERLAEMKRARTLTEMSEAELAGALQDAEAQRQAVKYRQGPEAAHTKQWARERKATIRAEYRRRGLAAPKGRSFESWAGVGA